MVNEIRTIRDRFDLAGKVALITGASKGIGAAIAEAYAAFGARVVVSSRKPEAVEAVAAAIRERGGEAVGIAANVGCSDDLDALVKDATDRFGALHILVNNAATNPVYGPLLETGNEAFDKIMAVNLKGPFHLSKLVLPHMLESGGGSIINISSIGGVSPEPGLAIYSVSKAALISLGKAMAREWGPKGVRVNTICPGLIKTKFSEALWRNDKTRAYFEKQLPSGRIGMPDDLAGIAVFLASEAGAYCTGGVYMVDGGYTI